jgi:hypothetical protein
MSDPNAPAHYSFLPWLRRGIIGLADAASLSQRKRLTVSLELQASGAGEAAEVVPGQVQLYGPGEISGLDRRAIVRTVPRAGVRNFETNYLCAIEFYDEDFPWRYSPFIAEAGKLPPWLWLVALSQEEFVRRGPSEGGLPSIELNGEALRTAFPDPATTWAWAHTHLNFNVEGATPAERQQMVADTLEDNPGLGCSRLVCPRRLRPGTRYTAFLVPAFEKGRLAGLGAAEADIAAVPNAEPAWLDPAGGKPVLPVYYEWEFATQGAGDFESLARLLAPLTEAEAQALSQSQANRQLDIRLPGWGLAYRGATGVISLESALRPIQQVPDMPITDRPAAEDREFTGQLAALLNLGTAAAAAVPSTPNPFYPDSNLHDDPIIVPPLYGSFYRGAPIPGTPAATPVALSPAAPISDWYNQLNLNPAWRVAAGQGTAVVQQDQEKYMDRAWDQVRLHYDTLRLVKRWDYSLEVSEHLFAKRFQPVLADAAPGDASENTFLALAFMAPLHQKLLLGDTSFSAALRQKALPGAYSRSFTKLIRNGGPLVRRLNRQQNKGAFFEEAAVVPPPKNVLFTSVTNLISFLELLARLLIFPPAHQRKDEALKMQGLAGYEAVKGAFTALQPYLQVLGIMVALRPANSALYRTIAEQISPRATLPARLRAILPPASQAGRGDASMLATPGLLARSPVLAGGILADAADARLAADTGSSRRAAAAIQPAVPVFPEAMYAPLASRSTDFILPGLDLVPANRVALLKTNPAFIEAYMVGLNHEISREYLWREFPAPLNTTAFSQFWDERDNPALEAGQDIQAIAAWGTAALGSHQPAGKAAEKMVVLIRGNLLEKYPHTEIFLQQTNPQANPPETLFRYPLFTAELEPDIRFIGFDLSPADALGSATQPGWVFVLKERAGEVHFGLDLDASTTDPSWPPLAAEVPEHSCLHVSSAAFQNLPRYSGDRADKLAAMLYQKPFMLFVPAARMVPKV